MTDIDAILVERRKQHGHFSDHAACAQSLKNVARFHIAKRAEDGRPLLTQTQLESIDMILHKLARVISGDATLADHWDDIAGYARIANYVPPPKVKEGAHVI